ncbi:MAG TPA: adenylate cyclase [Rhodobacteraceae bacterium]|jgi:CYTH domain-containing protein|nr:adenylate cyclase [Paracoccaceae bacterium]
MSGQEIERKFLLREMPGLEGARETVLRQGYLTAPGDSVEIRLRQAGTAHVLTLKSGAGMARVERETALSPEQFEALWPETDGRRIEKRRWTGALDDGLCFELDIYEGALAPLRLVEVEFPDEGAAARFAPPDWFGAEVTEDARFKNKALAVDGLPED